MKKIVLVLLLILLPLSLSVFGCDKKEPQKEIFLVEEITSSSESGVKIVGLTEYGKSLQSISIPSKINGFEVKIIGESTFEDMVNLFSITFSKDSVIKEIEFAGFRNCRNLSSIILPQSMTTIGDEAFAECINLESVTLPSNLTMLGSYAFLNCKKLTSIAIPDLLTTINPFTFNGCMELVSVTFGANSIMQKIDERAFFACHSLTDITLPQYVRTIEQKAFMDCLSLKSITIPQRVYELGEYVFEGCTNLTEVVFLDTEGWKAGEDIVLSKDNLENSQTCVDYFTILYAEFRWTKDTTT